MKAGDSVHDRITGETWVLAFYDAERDEAAWCGWPEGYVQEASTRLTVTKEATPMESVLMLRGWAARGGYDLRARTARHLLAGAVAALPFTEDRDTGDEATC